MVKTLVVAGRIKELCKDGKKQLNMSANLPAALTKKVEKILEDAVKRAKGNGRTTVMDKDL